MLLTLALLVLAAAAPVEKDPLVWPPACDTQAIWRCKDSAGALVLNHHEEQGVLLYGLVMVRAGELRRWDELSSARGAIINLCERAPSVCAAVEGVLRAAHDKGDREAGLVLGVVLQREGKLPLAATLDEALCARGLTLACANLAYLKVRGPLQDLPAARALLDRTCQAGLPDTCRTLARELADEGKQAEGAALYERACSLGDPDGCMLAAREHLELKDAEAAARAWKAACDLKDVIGCGAYGEAVMKGLGVPKDEAKGKAMLEAACDDGAQGACNALGGQGW
jgi:uncharacterized protein